MADTTEGLIDHILARGAVVRGDIRWRSSGGRARFRIEVDTEMGEPMTLEMHVSSRVPWQYSVQLAWRKRPVRRVDVRGSHSNVCDGSGTRWVRRTHKHRYSDNYEMAQAYTPEDIRVSSIEDFDASEYERVFEAFCRECGIETDVSWSLPPTPDEQGTIGDQRS